MNKFPKNRFKFSTTTYVSSSAFINQWYSFTWCRYRYRNVYMVLDHSAWYPVPMPGGDIAGNDLFSTSLMKRVLSHRDAQVLLITIARVYRYLLHVSTKHSTFTEDWISDRVAIPDFLVPRKNQKLCWLSLNKALIIFVFNYAEKKYAQNL